MPKGTTDRILVEPSDTLIRAMQKTDKDFVAGTFVRGACNSTILLNNQLPDYQSAMIFQYIFENIMKRATCFILCDSEYMDEIVGYTIMEREGNKIFIHWMYIKEIYRGIGHSRVLWDFITRNTKQDDKIYFGNISRRVEKILREHPEVDQRVVVVQSKQFTDNSFLTRTEELERNKEYAKERYLAETIRQGR